MSVKERICVKLNVRSGTDALDAALVEHLDHSNVRSAAAYLVEGHHASIASPPSPTSPASAGSGSSSTSAAPVVYLPKNEMLIVYSVDGVSEASGDVKVFVLDRTTMERHRQHAAAKRPIHYVVLHGQGGIPPADLSKVSAEIPFPGDHTDVLAGADWAARAPARLITLDANPNAAVMPASSTAAQLITRSSHSLSEAIAASEAAERGVANIDYEAAMTHCCAWLSETIDLVEQQFSVSEAAADSTLAIVEAFLQRNTALQKAKEFIGTDLNVFTRIERALHSSSAARQRWAQRKAGLDCLAESTRLCATWLALLANHAMSLKIRNPATNQSLDGTNATMSAVADALLVILATFPGQNLTESDQFTHYCHQRVVPRLTADLVGHAEKLLDLPQAFSVGVDPIPVLPPCVTEGVQSHFIAASWALRSWRHAWAQCVAILDHCHPTRLSEPAAGSAEAAAYASKRCEDLRDMMRLVNRASLGIMSTEVAVLYTLMRRAALAFGPLRAAEHLNWERFAAAFNKTLALKLQTVEDVPYDAPADDAAHDPVAPFAPLLSQTATSLNLTQTQTSLHNYTQRSLVNASMLTNASASAVMEEREVLSSRVTVMTQELAEARLLIAGLQGQLQRANASLAAAQELNVFMMAELRKAQLGDAGRDVPAPVGSREALIARLAAEEHARLEHGRQIEDEELDSP